MKCTRKASAAAAGRIRSSISKREARDAPAKRAPKARAPRAALPWELLPIAEPPAIADWEVRPKALRPADASGWKTVAEAGGYEYRIRSRRPEDEDWSVEYDGTSHVLAAFDAGSPANAAPLAKARCHSKVGGVYVSCGGARGGERTVVIATDDGRSEFFPGSVAVFFGGELVASELASSCAPVSVADDGRSVAFATKYGKKIVSIVRAADGRWVRRDLAIPRDDYARIAACEGGVRVLREFRYGLFRPAPEDEELERNFVMDRYSTETGEKTTVKIPRKYGSLLADVDGERILVAEPSRTEHPYDLVLHALDSPRKPRRHAGLGAAFCERARIRPDGSVVSGKRLVPM